MTKKYAFLDRDGTLIFEPQDTFQVDCIEVLQILPGVIEGLKELFNAGFSFVMVTNQNGIGTVSFPEEDFEVPQRKLLEILRKEGIVFERVFVCPHFPKDNCICRKPKTALVDDFMSKVDKESSFMLGDRDTDKEFAKNIGIQSYKMLTNSDQFVKIVNQILL